MTEIFVSVESNIIYIHICTHVYNLVFCISVLFHFTFLVTGFTIIYKKEQSRINWKFFLKRSTPEHPK